VKELVDKGFLTWVPLLPPEESNSFICKSGEDVLVKTTVLGGNQVVGLVVDPLQCLTWAQVVGTRVDAVVQLFLFETGDSDFEKLVEDSASDTQIAEAFEKGNPRVLG
jgi:hypothetical protein